MEKKVERTHDKEIYIKKNLNYEPKEIFKQLYIHLKKDKFSTILDVGCSNGELLNYLNTKFDKISCHGVDVSKELIDNAKQISNKKIEYSKIDFSKKNCKIGKYDRVICSGVIGIFDDAELILKNIFLNLDKKGKAFIFSFFNHYPYNVIIKYEDILNKKGRLQSGWNVHSLLMIEQICKKYKKKAKFHKFKMPISLKKNHKDLIRSWTKDIGKNRYFTNALGLLYEGYWIEIS